MLLSCLSLSPAHPGFLLWKMEEKSAQYMFPVLRWSVATTHCFLSAQQGEGEKHFKHAISLTATSLRSKVYSTSYRWESKGPETGGDVPQDTQQGKDPHSVWLPWKPALTCAPPNPGCPLPQDSHQLPVYGLSWPFSVLLLWKIRNLIKSCSPIIHQALKLLFLHNLEKKRLEEPMATEWEI